MLWTVWGVAELTIAVTYLAVAGAILRSLASSRQLLDNRLGLATALIFVFCAGGHALHFSHGFGSGAVRASVDWHLMLWSMATAGVGLYYWTLRRVYSPYLRGAQLFEDLRGRQCHALEINDKVIQGLTVARVALSLGDHEECERALDSTLSAARSMIDGLLGPHGRAAFVRTRAASLCDSCDPDTPA